MDEGDRLQLAGNLEQALVAHLKAKRWDAAAKAASALGRHLDAGHYWLEARFPYEAAICFRKIGALRDCQSALLLVPQSSPRYRDACVHVVSVALILGTSTSSLMAFLAPFLSSVPNSRPEAAALNQLADTLAEEKKFRLANSIYRSVLSAFPNDADATDGLASLAEKERVAAFVVRPSAPSGTSAAGTGPAPSAPRPPSGPRRATVGEVLVARGRLKAADLEQVLKSDPDVDSSDVKLVDALVDAEMVVPLEVIQTFAELSGLPWISDEKLFGLASRELAEVLTQEQIESWNVVPLSLADRHLHVAMRDPRDVALLDRVRFASGMKQVSGVFATERGVRRAIGRLFHGETAPEPIPVPAAPPPPPSLPLDVAAPFPLDAFDTGALDDLMSGLPPMPTESASGPRQPTLQLMPQMPEVGSTFAERYELLALIGEGGSASVFRAQDRELGEPVALKIFRPTGQVESDDVIARFKLELSLSRLLTHPNIIRLFDLGLHSGLRYLSMELLEGTDLYSKIFGHAAPVPIAEGLGYLEQVCLALRAAHERGVIHRDIKPHNLFLTTEGVVKVMDFGIAKRLHSPGVTIAGMVRGTPEYISPEQINSFSNVTHHTDLYALGATAYAMFTGAPPFEHPELTALLMAHASAPPVPPRLKNAQIPEALEAVILKLLEKAPEQRIQSAKELGEQLRAIRLALESPT